MRPKCAEINFLPNFPQGHDQATLETLRQEITEEFKKKKKKNATLISKMMQTIFALRQQVTVTTSPPVKQFLELWPALRMEAEVYAEFQRITNQNLPSKFYAEHASFDDNVHDEKHEDIKFLQDMHGI
ncbi:hypothetical protein AOLI_G00228970 [Acnodon oligacanthus]